MSLKIPFDKSKKNLLITRHAVYNESKVSPGYGDVDFIGFVGTVALCGALIECDIPKFEKIYTPTISRNIQTAHIIQKATAHKIHPIINNTNPNNLENNFKDVMKIISKESGDTNFICFVANEPVMNTVANIAFGDNHPIIHHNCSFLISFEKWSDFKRRDYKAAQIIGLLWNGQNRVELFETAFYKEISAKFENVFISSDIYKQKNIISELEQIDTQELYNITKKYGNVINFTVMKKTFNRI